MRNIHKFFLFAALLPLALLVHNNTAHWHFHQKENGQWIRHAHPSAQPNGEEGNNDHNHSKQEHQILAVMAELNGLEPDEIKLDISLIVFKDLNPLGLDSSQFIPFSGLTRKFRGPPSSTLLHESIPC